MFFFLSSVIVFSTHRRIRNKPRLQGRIGLLCNTSVAGTGSGPTATRFYERRSSCGPLRLPVRRRAHHWSRSTATQAAPRPDPQHSSGSRAQRGRRRQPCCSAFGAVCSRQAQPDIIPQTQQDWAIPFGVSELTVAPIVLF